jgi:hypothetical protein
VERWSRHRGSSIAPSTRDPWSVYTLSKLHSAKGKAAQLISRDAVTHSIPRKRYVKPRKMNCKKVGKDQPSRFLKSTRNAQLQNSSRGRPVHRGGARWLNSANVEAGYKPWKRETNMRRSGSEGRGSRNRSEGPPRHAAGEFQVSAYGIQRSGRMSFCSIQSSGASSSEAFSPGATSSNRRH